MCKLIITLSTTSITALKISSLPSKFYQISFSKIQPAHYPSSTLPFVTMVKVWCVCVSACWITTAELSVLKFIHYATPLPRRPYTCTCNEAGIQELRHLLFVMSARDEWHSCCSVPAVTAVVPLPLTASYDHLLWTTRHVIGTGSPQLIDHGTITVLEGQDRWWVKFRFVRPWPSPLRELRGAIPETKLCRQYTLWSGINLWALWIVSYNEYCVLDFFFVLFNHGGWFNTAPMCLPTVGPLTNNSQAFPRQILNRQPLACCTVLASAAV